MKIFNLVLKNKANKNESAEVRIKVLPDRRWSISIFGSLVMPDKTKEYFEYITKGTAWQDDNVRLEKYVRHRIKVCVGKDILNTPTCPIKDKNGFWKKEGAWLIDFDQTAIRKAWA